MERQQIVLLTSEIPRSHATNNTDCYILYYIYLQVNGEEHDLDVSVHNLDLPSIKING